MRIRAYIAMFVAVGWMACDNLATIDVHQEGTTTVPKGNIVSNLVGDMGYGQFLNMNIMDSEELQNQGVKPGDINHVFLQDLSLTETDPSGGDLSFLSSVKVYVESDGLPKALIAEADSFPAGQATVDFTVTANVDLTDYVTSENMSLTTDVTGRQPDADTQVKATFDLAVGVTAQGACNYSKQSGS